MSASTHQPPRSKGTSSTQDGQSLHCAASILGFQFPCTLLCCCWRGRPCPVPAGDWGRGGPNQGRSSPGFNALRHSPTQASPHPTQYAWVASPHPTVTEAVRLGRLTPPHCNGGIAPRRHIELEHICPHLLTWGTGMVARCWTGPLAMSHVAKPYVRGPQHSGIAAVDGRHTAREV